MICVEARVPLHLSIVWVPVETGDPRSTGSLGAGLMLEPGVRARACSTPGGYRGPRLPTVTRCLEALGWRGELVEVETSYPPGYGLGVSGAAALAACLAYAGLRGVGSVRAADEAHVAEVLERTGLGDVTALYTAWGLEVRLKPGAPGAGGYAEAHPVHELPVAAVPVTRLDTGVMLREMWSRVSRGEAVRVYERVRSEPSLETLGEAARVFTMRATPPPPEAVELLRYCTRRALLAVYKKGSVVIVAEDEESLEAFEGCARGRGFQAYRLRLSNTRPYTTIL